MNTVKRQPGRPRDEALQERRREEILDQAIRVFARHGYQAADVQGVADAIGVSKGTIYHYFPSKEQLFLAAVRRGVQRLYAVLTVARQEAHEPFEAIGTVIATYLQFFKENPEIVELFIQERAHFREQKRPIYFEHRDAQRGPWRQLFVELMAEGRLREMPVERVIDVIGDVLYGTMFTNHFAGNSKSFQQQASDILDIVYHGILAEAEKQGLKNPGLQTITR